MAEKYLLTISETEELLRGEATWMLTSRFPLRYERSGQFMFREDALRCLGGGILMNAVMGIEENDLEYGRFGKPFVSVQNNDDSACPDDDNPAYANNSNEFNISHSGEMVVLAVADSPVGIDIEKIDPRHTDIAEHVFTEDELKWMLGEDPLDRFYVLWTMKESLMKATGLGLNLPPKSFSVMDGIRTGLLLHEGIEYKMQSEKMGEYRIAVCEEKQTG